jgi:hypothetical protein
MGLDVPTFTPTPVAGAIEVYVEDGIPLQGVTVFVVDPTGNTLPSAITQPSVGYAAFNPANTKAGLWSAYIPSQSVCFVSNPGGNNLTTINNYYYYSQQNFMVNSIGSGSCTFQNNGDSIYLEPTSIVYNGTFPNNYPITAIYQNNGNLNKPVSVSFSETGGTLGNSIPSVFGEGVSIFPMLYSLNTCTFQPVTIAMSATYFTGIGLNVTECPVKKNWIGSISLYYCWGSNDPYNDWSLGITTSGDCGTNWTVNILNSGMSFTDYLGCCGIDENNGTFWTKAGLTNSFTISNGSYSFSGSFTANSYPSPSNPITVFSTNF